MSSDIPDQNGQTEQTTGFARRMMSRRNVVRTAAWTAPTVALLNAAPAFADGSVTATNGGYNVTASGFRSPDGVTKTTNTDGRAFVTKFTPYITTASASTLAVTATISTLPAGAGVAWADAHSTNGATYSTLPSGWSFVSATDSNGNVTTDSTTTNATAWTFSGAATADSSSSSAITIVLGRVDTNASSGGAITSTDVGTASKPTPGIQLVVSTADTSVASGYRTATFVESGGGTNATYVTTPTWS